MNLGSHNSFTYLPVRKLWMKPLAFTARCQRVEIWKQVLLGVRMFDLRVRFDEHCHPIICHGLIEYKHDKNFIDDILEEMNTLKCYHIRVVLELNKYDGRQQTLFAMFCQHIEQKYTNITFSGGNDRTDWDCKNPIYRFKHKLEDLDDKYASTTSLFPEKKGLIKYIDDLYPLLYAKKFNHKNIQAGTKHKWLFIDFVDIQ